MLSLEVLFADGRRELVAPGEHLGGFEERGRYVFPIVDTGLRLYVDDLELEHIHVQGVPAWEWRPGFYAGEVLAELVAPDDSTLAHYRFEVSPSSAKLGQSSFNEMVDDLFHFDPRLLIGTEPGVQSIGTAGQVRNPHLEYTRLRRFGPLLVRALQTVSARPVQQLHHGRRVVPANRARRIDATGVRHLLGSASGLFLLGRLDTPIPGCPDASVNVSWSFANVDNPANRTLFATLRAAQSRIVAISRALAAEVETLDPTRTEVVARVPRRLRFLQQLAAAFRRVERSSPFDTVSRAEVSSAGLNAVAAHPAYASAFRLGWHMLRAGIEGNRDESLWSSPTWEIYERWCFAAIVASLEQLYPGLQWERRFDADDRACFSTTLEHFRVAVWLQRSFAAWDCAHSGFRSISGARRPDILVTVEDGSSRRWIVLDAKYRHSRSSVLEGMQSAHVYRDALRWHDTLPAAAVLLVPRAGEAPWLECPEFIDEHGVGVMELSDRSHLEGVGERIRQILGLPAR